MAGLELGLGLARDAIDLRGPGTASFGMHCGTCGSTGRIDMIDTTVRRAYLTCPACGRIWDTDRKSVPAQPFFARAGRLTRRAVPPARRRPTRSHRRSG